MTTGADGGVDPVPPSDDARRCNPAGRGPPSSVSGGAGKPVLSLSVLLHHFRTSPPRPTPSLHRGNGGQFHQLPSPRVTLPLPPLLLLHR